MTNQRNARSFLDEQKLTIQRRYLGSLNYEFMQDQVHEEDLRYRPDGPFQRDYARIMYSSSFRRLQGKMQLFMIQNDQFFRNRLTHSLEVAQIARSIATAIGYNPSEIYVVEAGALAHDIGNPPFGHAGESHLNEIFKDIGGFEGNAQTLRIMTSVEKKRAVFKGLNLTYRTMLSVVKYFKKYDQIKGGKQKFIYDEDYQMLNKFLTENEVKVRTLDVQIVDTADEIAYAAHDLEDGLRIKAYTIDEVLYDYKNEYGESESYHALIEVVEESKAQASSYVSLDATEFSKLFRQELCSRLINLALNDIGLINVNDTMREKTGTTQDQELGFTKYGELIKGLKKIVFKCINHNNDVYHYEQEGKRVLSGLVELYRNDARYLPPEYRVGDGNADLQDRLICDYIAGMMDSYSIVTYEKYTGKKFLAGNTGRL